MPPGWPSLPLSGQVHLNQASAPQTKDRPDVLYVQIRGTLVPSDYALETLADLLVFLLISPVNLLISCKFITLFVIFFHAIILPDYRFFFEIPSFEELQDPKISPRREEVGRRTLRDYGGFLLSFFYRARFRLFNEHYSKTSS